jgi:hypothetical protein
MMALTVSQREAVTKTIALAGASVGLRGCPRMMALICHSP